MIALAILAVSVLATIGAYQVIQSLAASLDRRQRARNAWYRAQMPVRCQNRRHSPEATTRIWEPTKTVTWDRLANDRHVR